MVYQPSLVVSPHAQHLDDGLIFQDLIHEPVLNVDSLRESAMEISDQFLNQRPTRSAPRQADRAVPAPICRSVRQAAVAKVSESG